MELCRVTIVRRSIARLKSRDHARLPPRNLPGPQPRCCRHVAAGDYSPSPRIDTRHTSPIHAQSEQNRYFESVDMFCI
jgi:hypothetical protein